MNEFEDIAEEYTEVKTLIIREVLDNTLHHVLGDINGKTVLDLACGNGFYTRRLKEAGASRVVGVDIAKDMIQMAKEEEENNPLGIEYILGNVEKIGVIDEFDYVTASFLFANALTKETILKMSQAVYNNLKAGGRFVSANGNNKRSPEEIEASNYRKYGLTTKIISELPDGGATMEVTVYLPQQVFSFNSHVLKYEVYQSALEIAGFKNLTWYDKMIISPALKEEYGEDFWDYLLENPLYAILECEK